MRDLKQELREELKEILPKSQHNKIEKLIATFESYFDDSVRSIEVIGAHIETSHVEYPGGDRRSGRRGQHDLRDLR